MKKLLLILLYVPLIISGQTLIPDANFEQALINLGYDMGIPNGSVPTANIDTVTFLDVNSLSISDLTGIEDFTALTELWCNSNQLTSLDVSNNIDLEILWCHANNLTSLDISNITSLTYLNCRNNQLNNLDVSNNTGLAELWCHNNILSNLNIGNNTSLTDLNCGNNLLSTLDVSQNPAIYDLYCFDNKLTTLDISQNTNLFSLRCENNLLISLNINNGHNTNMLTHPFNFNLTNNPQLYCITVDDSIWSANNWTVANGNIDPTMSFSKNCAIALGCIDSLACNYDSLATINDSSCIYSTSSTISAALSNYSGWNISCLGCNDGWIAINISGGDPPFNYLWNNGAVSDSIYNLYAGFYSVIITDDLGCSQNISFNLNEPATSIGEFSTYKNLLKVIDILGREVDEKRNTPLFHIYNDGTVEKKIIVE